MIKTTMKKRDKLFVLLLAISVLLMLSGMDVYAKNNSKHIKTDSDGTRKYTIPPGAEFDDEHILVKFRADTPDSQKANIHKKNNGKSVKHYKRVRGYKVKVQKNRIAEAINDYLKDENVEYAEPDYIRKLFLTPNDTDYSQLWGLHNTGQSGGTADADIDMPEAWDIETGDSAVVIAVTDSGVDWDHPDLAANIWTNSGEIVGNGVDDDGNGYIDDVRGWDFVNVGSGSVYPGEDPGPADNDPMDFYGHGTHVSGIASAIGDNNEGIAGVSWNSKIMALRVAYKHVSGVGALSTSSLIEAISYAADNGADIINFSLGGTTYSSSEKDAIDFAYSQGVVMVAAAGNEDTSDKNYPAAYDNVLSVAATDHNDARASFSNYGSWIDVSAPGEDIYSTMFDDSYGLKTGTSMSSPYVAGLAALIRSKYPAFPNDEVMRRIEASADDVDAAGWDQYTGSGRINAYQALQINSWITSPAENEKISGSLNITGVATSANFSYYRVEYGLSYTPTAWVQIGIDSFTPVASGILAGWDTTGLVDGNYTIKLTVQNTDATSYVDTKVMTVANGMGNIAFVSSRDGDFEIYIMNADGSNQTRLTVDPAIDIYPSFSPDGSKIVFSSYRDGNAEIYVMDVDGSNIVRLTNNSAYDLGPVFSPDGSKIAFFSDRNGDYDIFVMNADGSSQIALTNYADWDMYPKWSPDGTKIVFCSTYGSSDRNIHIMNADGTNVFTVTSDTDYDARPAFSPDGKSIVFVSNRGNADFYDNDVYTIDVDGDNPIQLTTGTHRDDLPLWSVDGSKIAYESNLSGANQVYSMNTDGTAQTVLTSISDNNMPSWGPYVPDTAAPSGTIVIDGGTTYTNTTSVNLELSCDDGFGGSCAEMQFSNDNASWSGWETYETSKVWTLDAVDGLRTVYVQYKDGPGNVSASFSDTVTLDSTYPVTTADPEGGSFNSAQSVTLTCDDGSGLGCDEIYYTTDGSLPTTSSNIYSTPLSILSTTQLLFFSTDVLGNSETVKSEIYTIDTTAPIGGISINSEAPLTNSISVILTLSASDPSGVSEMMFSNDDISYSSAEAYAVTKTWILTSGDGLKTVYVKYKDNAGNWSAAVFDTIALDATSDTTVFSDLWVDLLITDSAWDYSSMAIDSNDKLHISYTDGTLKYVTNISGSFVASTIDSTGTVGQYSSIAVDSNNKVHISYYDSTNSSLKYTTNISGTWVTSTIDNTGSVGKYTSIAVDSNNKAHISYYDSTGNYDLKYATNSSGSWVTATIDSTGYVGEYTSIAVDSNDKVHISYYDSSSNYDLKYATNASGSWITSTVDSAGSVGMWTSIAVDSNNKVHIGYKDQTNLKIKYMTNASGSWIASVIDDTLTCCTSYNFISIDIDTNDKVHISYMSSDSGYLEHATNVSGNWSYERVGPNGDNISLALDSNNRAHIIYHDFSELRYTTNTLGPFNTSTVDNTSNMTNTSMAIDSLNKVHISYCDNSNRDLKYATNASGSWVTSTIGYVGYSSLGYSSIAIDSNNNVHISYNNGDLLYATNASGSWVTSIIDSIGSVGEYSSIAIDSSNKIHISYFDDTNDDLKYATDVSGTWVVSTIDSTGYVGRYTSLAVDSSDNVHISYYDSTNYDLKHATDVTGSWVIETVDSSGSVGIYTSIDIDSLDKAHISYYDSTNGKLKYTTNRSGSWVSTNIGWMDNYTSIAIDSNDDVHIVFMNYDNLSYATNSLGAWVVAWVITESIWEDGRYPSVAIDSNNKVHISHSDLKYNLVYSSDILDAFPTIGSVSINAGDTYTSSHSVTLTISAADSDGISEMRIANAFYESPSWEPYTTSKAWNLFSGTGSRSVYIQFKDTQGNHSEIYSDSISLDTTAPEGEAVINSENLNSIIDAAGYVGQYSSIAVDSNNKKHISYYQSSGSDLKYATDVSGSWVASTIDSAGAVGLDTYIAVDSSDKLHISYYDASNSSLKYATNATGSWVMTTIDHTDTVGRYSSISIDSNDKAHISYFDDTNDDLKYATNATGAWVVSTIDSTGIIGRYSTSIALDLNDKVHISYYDDTSNNLKYATNATGSWVKSAIDSAGPNFSLSSHTSIGIDSNNKVHIAYYGTSANLEYATNETGSWVTSVVDSSGYYCDLAIDSNDKVHISCYGPRYTTNESGSWESSTIETGGQYTSIALGSDGKVHISYYEYSNNRDLKYAQVGAASYTDSTSVNLSLYASDSNGVSEMILSNDGVFDIEIWETYATNKAWTLETGDGTKTVYVRYKDIVGNVSSTYSDDIALDGSTPPSTLASPVGGLYNIAQSVTLTCDDGAGSGCDKTYYTTDGTTPTTSSSVYAVPINISTTIMLKFFSTDLAGNSETVKTEVYTIDVTAPTTTANPAGGLYNATQNVTLTCDESSGSGCDKSYYTINGITPTTSSNVYTGPIDIPMTTTLKFFSTDLAGNSEAIITENYIIDSSSPTTTASPLGGAYSTSQSVNLTCDDGAGSGCDKTYYTTDGTTPTTSSSVYAVPINVLTTTMLKFFSTDMAGNQESIKTELYTITAAQYTLITAVSPLNSGTITPDCSGGCMYDSGNVVVLTANEDSNQFKSWSGCDDPNGQLCTMTMDDDKSVTAVFDSCMFPVRVVGATTDYYSLLQDAYDGAADGDTLQIQHATFNETNLTFNLDGTIYLEGGYDCNYSVNTGTSTVNGDILINNGLLILQNGSLEVQ